MTQQETGYEGRRGFTEIDPGESISYLIVGRTRHGAPEYNRVVYTLNEVKRMRRKLWSEYPYLIITVYSFLDKAAPPSTSSEDTPNTGDTYTGGVRMGFGTAVWGHEEDPHAAPDEPSE